jgi:hypothetical protein
VVYSFQSNTIFTALKFIIMYIYDKSMCLKLRQSSGNKKRLTNCIVHYFISMADLYTSIMHSVLGLFLFCRTIPMHFKFEVFGWQMVLCLVMTLPMNSFVRWDGLDNLFCMCVCVCVCVWVLIVESVALWYISIHAYNVLQLYSSS